MPDNRRKTFHTAPPRRAVTPLQHLERVQPVYFFTPDLEREINKLDGVTSSRVLTTGSEIDEIHVIAPPNRVPKKLVRDIESLLLVHFGIRIDHRKISVVQMERGPAPTPGIVRPRIQNVERLTGETTRGIRVSVLAGDQVLSGMSEVRADESELYSSSRALINAIEQMLNTRGIFELQNLEELNIRSQTIILTVLSWTLEGEQEILVGASVVRADPAEAAARATLDAMNRKLVRIEPSQ